MGLGVVGAAGGIPPQNAPAGKGELKSDQAMIRDLTAQMKVDIRDMSQEVHGRITQRAKGEVPDGQQGQRVATTDQKKPPTQTVSFTPQDTAADAAKMAKKPPAEAAAMAAAALSEEEKKARRKKRQLAFEKKMELLSGLEDSLTDVEFEKLEDKEAVKEFFDNMTKIRKKQKQLRQLDIHEKQLQDELSAQEEREALSGKSKGKKGAKNASPQPVEISPEHLLQGSNIPISTVEDSTETEADEDQDKEKEPGKDKDKDKKDDQDQEQDDQDQEQNQGG